MTDLSSASVDNGPIVLRGFQEQPKLTSGSLAVSSWRESFDAIKRAAWENGITCASLACIIFAFSSLQVKLTGGRVPVLQLCIIRSSISFLTSILSGRAAGIQPLFGHKQHFPLLFLRGLCGTVAITTSYVSVLTLPLGDAITISQMRPPFTAVMARVLLGEPLGVQGAAGCLLSVVGVVILAHPPFLSGGHHAWSQKRLVGTLAGVVSTLCSSGTTYAVRKIGKKEPALTVALWFHITTIGLLTWPLLAGVPESAKPVAWHDCLLLLGIATASFLAQLLMTRSYQLLAAARAAAVSFMGVIYSHILGALIFKEQVTAATVGGGVLIFVGVLMVTLKNDSSNSSSTTAAAAGTGVQCDSKIRVDTGTPGAGDGDGVPLIAADRDDHDPLVSDLQRDLPVSQQHLFQKQDGTRSTLRPSGLHRPVWLHKLLSGRQRHTTNSSSSSSGLYQHVEYEPAADLDQELARSNTTHHGQDLDHDDPAGSQHIYVYQAPAAVDQHESGDGLLAMQAGRLKQIVATEDISAKQLQAKLSPPGFELPTFVQSRSAALEQVAGRDHQHMAGASSTEALTVCDQEEGESDGHHPSLLRGQSPSWASWGSWRFGPDHQ